MYNLRYHLASLVAVFLALALGLVLGGLVVQQGTFTKQQKALVGSLQRDFRKQKSDNTRLRREAKAKDVFSTQMISAWMTGRLKGRTVVVITSGAEDEGAAEAEATIKEAGGKAVVVTLLDEEFGLGDETVAKAVRALVPTPTALRAGLVQGLASEWTTATASRPITGALVDAEAIDVNGLKASAAATSIVDVASFADKPDEVALDVCRAYADMGFSAMGAERSEAATGVAHASAARGLSAFDTLGTEFGRFTLVALLSGGEQGFFGADPKAGKQFPSVP